MLSREQITRKNFCTCSVQMNFLKKYFQSEVLWNYRQKAGCLWATERVIGTSDTLTTITFKFQNLNSSRLKWQYSRSFHFVFCKSHNWKSSYRAKDLHLLMRKTKGRRGLGARDHLVQLQMESSTHLCTSASQLLPPRSQVSQTRQTRLAYSFAWEQIN